MWGNDLPAGLLPVPATANDGNHFSTAPGAPSATAPRQVARGTVPARRVPPPGPVPGPGERGGVLPWMLEQSDRRALLLMGPRQVGKTVLLLQTADDLLDATTSS